MLSPLIFLLSDKSLVYAVPIVKYKESLQLHSFPIVFLFSGAICMFTLSDLKCNKRLKQTFLFIFLLSNDMGIVKVSNVKCKNRLLYPILANTTITL